MYEGRNWQTKFQAPGCTKSRAYTTDMHSEWGDISLGDPWDGFAMCIPLDIRHSNREGQDSDQGSEWDTD